MADWSLHILEEAHEMHAIERLQSQVWPDSERDVVPAHLLLTAAHNGGLVIGAYPDADSSGTGEQGEPVGFVFGFPGFYSTPDGPRLKHCSHMLGVRADYRSRGLGFALKRAQWQMVRHQGLDLVTWTYDPLLSRNAYLNIARLGAVCSTYHTDLYGEMRDALNAGLPSDRFQVDWWVNTQRVHHRLSSKPRRSLDLANFLAAGARILNPSTPGDGRWAQPAEEVDLPEDEREAVLLVELPADFLALKADDFEVARAWRYHLRKLFQGLFERGYLVTDFVHLEGAPSRSFYVLSHGESTL